MAIVDPAISRRKLDRELAAWQRVDAAYRRRGYVIVSREHLQVDVTFHARLPVSVTPEPLPGMSVCARLDFTNYDLWAPSVTFVDFFTGTPVIPGVRALDYDADARTPQGEPVNMLINPHPQTGLAFLCHRGVREYHSHLEHNGDSWLLHRGGGLGTLAAICELIWRLMARNVVGLRLDLQELPAPFTGRVVQAGLAQGDVNAVSEQLREQLAAAGQPVPPR